MGAASATHQVHTGPKAPQRVQQQKQVQQRKTFFGVSFLFHHLCQVQPLFVSMQSPMRIMAPVDQPWVLLQLQMCDPF